MYTEYTEYEGFTTEGVWDLDDGAQYVRLKDGPLIWISPDGRESVWVKD